MAGGADMTQENRSEQNIIVTERQRTQLTGIGEVDSFTDREIVAFSSLGEIVIEGEELHIESFSTETGELRVHGRIDGIYYVEEKAPVKKGLFGRMTK